MKKLLTILCLSIVFEVLWYSYVSRFKYHTRKIILFLNNSLLINSLCYSRLKVVIVYLGRESYRLENKIILFQNNTILTYSISINCLKVVIVYLGMESYISREEDYIPH